MPHDLLLTPQLVRQRAAQLTRRTKRLDEQLDHPTGVPQPIPQSGLLERLGTLLREATRLEAEAIRAALEDGVLTTLLTCLEEQRYHAVILSMHGTPARNSQGTERHRGCCSRTHTRAARRLWLEVIWQRSSTASHVAIGLG